jgi:NADH dehydrogenase
VLILGGGFAGVGAAQKLKDAPAEVVLIDRHDYHTFQPLLYQLATELLERTGVGHSLRDLLEAHGHATIHKASVTGIDLDARAVTFAEIEPISYDYLVLGLGAEVNFFGTNGAAEHAFPMYTLTHAVRLKDHLLERWEAADHEPALVADGALNVVVVGGGPTGVETAGALAELYRGDFAKDYREVDEDDARITLVEAGPELFRMFKPNLRDYATKALEERSVEVRTSTAVASISPNVVGDVAAIVDSKTEQVLPQLGSVALQSGEHAGETIGRRLADKEANSV